MADEQTGGMIALMPRTDDAAALTLPRGESAEELHLTLTYLGDDVSAMDTRQRNALAAAVANVAVMLPPVAARVFGHATFNPDAHGDRTPCAVYLVGDSTVLGPLRHELSKLAATDAQHEPFVAHVTAGYGVDQRKLTFTGPVVFDRLRLTLAGDHYDFPLGEPMQKGMHMADHIETKRRRAPVTLIPTVSALRSAIVDHHRASDKAEHKALVIRSARALDALDLLPAVWTKAVTDELGLVEADEAISEWVNFEAKVMSPSPNAARLREYWAHGPGRKKWNSFRSLRRHLAKYVTSTRVLDGLTANIYKLATGTWPGRRGGEKSAATTITAEEFKAAMLMADPDADLDLVAGLESPFEEDDDDEDGEVDSEDEAYEQALMDDFAWSINADGELERDEDAPTGDDPAEEDVAPTGPRPVAEGYSLFN